MLQYIGARYVPIFYKNSLDPTSSEWEANVTYEPMTWVSLPNGYMYISKKTVPANIGTPAQNGEYWLEAGQYNAYIQSLQDQIDDIKDGTVPGSIQSQINDMNDGSVSGSLQNQIDNIETELKNNLTNGTIIVLGDSWTDQNDYSTYPNRTGWLHDRIQLNNKIHCYGVSGSGVSSLDNQIAAAIADVSFENGSVKEVVIVSGVNDYLVGTPTNTYISDINDVYDTIVQNFPNANVTQLFNSLSPNSRTAPLTAVGCYNYFKSIVNNLKYPCYYLGLYLAVMSDYETWSGGMNYSNHPSTQGGDIVGRVFDQVINDKTPDIIRDFANTTPIDGGYHSIYNIVNNVGTQGTISRVDNHMHTVANSMEMTQLITTQAIIGAKILALQFTPDNFTRDCFVEPDLLKPIHGMAYSYANMVNNEICNVGETLYSGAYGDLSYTNALFFYLKDSLNIDRVAVTWVNK